jgi:hypothetical protein
VREVRPTLEFDRIAALKRRVLELPPDLLQAYRDRFGPVWPIQVMALHDASLQNGGFFPIGVGHGKTLITLLLPTVMNSKSAVLLVPAQLKKQLARELESFYLKTFKIPQVPHVFSYNDLSSAKQADLLTELKPDLIVADEAHNLKHRSASRTKRFLRYFKENPGTRFCALSGTMTSRSIFDYAHLSELSLQKNSPLPRSYNDLLDWSCVLDAEPMEPGLPGALLNLCSEGETVRSGYRRRLIETPGVVATEESAIGTSLYIEAVPVKPTIAVTQAIEKLNKTWAIDGVEFNSAPHKALVARTLTMGFYYTYDWPDGIVDTEWLNARNAWNRTIRHILKTRSKKGFDSPLFINNAATLGKLRTDEQQTYAEWKLLENRPEPKTKTIWVSEYALDGIKQVSEPGTIIWYEWQAMESLFEKAGIPHYGQGSDAGEATADIIACSFGSQGTGKNLQRFSKNVFTSFPPNGTLVEQVLGRTHRPGQTAEEVLVKWWNTGAIAEACYWRARNDAKYKQETAFGNQKLNFANKINEPEDKGQDDEWT